MIFLYLKKLVGACGTSRWPLLAFRSSIRSIVTSFISQRMLASITQRSSDDKFSPPSLFSLLHLKRCTGLAKLQSISQSFNCIEFDLFVFLISSFDIWIFMFFLSNLIVIVLISIEFDHHSYYCNSFYFEFSSWLIIFFLQFHLLLFNFIEFSYHILCLFFYYYFKTRLESRLLLYLGLGRITRVIKINRIFLLYMK
jgi:hypothetical protein